MTVKQLLEVLSSAPNKAYLMDDNTGAEITSVLIEYTANGGVYVHFSTTEIE